MSPRQAKPSLVEVTNPPKTTSNRVFGATNLIRTRDDTLLVYGTYAVAVASNVAVLGAAGVGLRHKIYACGYTVDAAVQTGFRFNSVNPRFCVRRTAGVFAQSFPCPIVSAANATLTLRVEGASNGDFWVQYVTEA